MRKKRVLFVTEASFHPTGYSVYTKEVLTRLNKCPDIEIAELACFTASDSEELKSIPWKVYPNIPPASNEEATQAYNSTMQNKFGEFSYNHVLLDFKPDFVMDIRDWWMLEFEERSPFREFYNWVIMPTVDAEPQNAQWVETYSNADGVLTYSEFGRDVLLKQSKAIKFVDIASPCASDVFFPIQDKNSVKNSMGIEDNTIIFGTVMRNQRRKLYADLFKSFRILLDKHPESNNVFLYCHTSYPDVGWDIPELIFNSLDQFGLGNKVLFTYKCKQCGHAEACFFNDAVTFCSKCGNLSSTLVGISNRMEDTDLNKVYNCFDVYVQWANSEGWGMPQLEAAYAGLPVVSVHYSAMASLIDNIQGIGIKPIALYKELETGCNRAVPDNSRLAETFYQLSSDTQKRKYLAKKCQENARKIYNWDYTANKWLKYFKESPIKDDKETWNSPAKIFNPPKTYPKDIASITPSDQVNWLMLNVLNKPEFIGKSLWKKTVKDLTYRMSLSTSIPGYYYNDYSYPDSERKYEEFTFDKAFSYFVSLRENLNNWEKIRTSK
jgi:glycosyltransferase involved in cell wall biosynthesis